MIWDDLGVHRHPFQETSKMKKKTYNQPSKNRFFPSTNDMGWYGMIWVCHLKIGYPPHGDFERVHDD